MDAWKNANLATEQRVAAHRRRAAASCGRHFVADVMQADHLRPLSLIEVTADSITHHRAEFVQRFRFGEDGVAQRTRAAAPSGASSTWKMISFMGNLGRLADAAWRSAVGGSPEHCMR
jgi:hypothetical protein